MMMLTTNKSKATLTNRANLGRETGSQHLQQSETTFSRYLLKDQRVALDPPGEHIDSSGKENEPKTHLVSSTRGGGSSKPSKPSNSSSKSKTNLPVAPLSAKERRSSKPEPSNSAQGQPKSKTNLPTVVSSSKQLKTTISPRKSGSSKLQPSTIASKSKTSIPTPTNIPSSSKQVKAVRQSNDSQQR